MHPKGPTRSLREVPGSAGLPLIYPLGTERPLPRINLRPAFIQPASVLNWEKSGRTEKRARFLIG